MNDPAVVAWVAINLGTEDFGKSQGIGVIEDGDPIAGFVYSNYSRRYRDVEMSAYAESPRWCLRGILFAIFAYPFLQMDCERVSAVCEKNNKRSRKLVEGLGFKHEGKKRGSVERVFYGMMRDECRWINGQG